MGQTLRRSAHQLSGYTPSARTPDHPVRCSDRRHCPFARCRDGDAQWPRL